MFDVPYLSEGQLEREADVLLAQFHGARQTPLALPTPVDDILERHLGLTLELGDLHGKLGIPVIGGKRDLLGALWADDRGAHDRLSKEPCQRTHRVAGGLLRRLLTDAPRYGSGGLEDSFR